MKLPVFHLQQLLIILRQEPVVDQMASLILKTVIIPIRDAIRANAPAMGSESFPQSGSENAGCGRSEEV